MFRYIRAINTVKAVQTLKQYGLLVDDNLNILTDTQGRTPIADLEF